MIQFLQKIQAPGIFRSGEVLAAMTKAVSRMRRSAKPILFFIPIKMLFVVQRSSRSDPVQSIQTVNWRSCRRSCCWNQHRCRLCNHQVSKTGLLETHVQRLVFTLGCLWLWQWLKFNTYLV